jgi:hypothetical protein
MAYCDNQCQMIIFTALSISGQRLTAEASAIIRGLRIIAKSIIDIPDRYYEVGIAPAFRERFSAQAVGNKCIALKYPDQCSAPLSQARLKTSRFLLTGDLHGCRLTGHRDLSHFSPFDHEFPYSPERADKCDALNSVPPRGRESGTIYPNDKSCHWGPRTAEPPIL